MAGNTDCFDEVQRLIYDQSAESAREGCHISITP
jgi:hypothetical protein